MQLISQLRVATKAPLTALLHKNQNLPQTPGQSPNGDLCPFLRKVVGYQTPEGQKKNLSNLVFLGGISRNKGPVDTNCMSTPVWTLDR